MKEPSGLVTFLFTDIEGSTRLAQEFPDSLPAALEKHNAILHNATESNNGFVYEIVGDAFCCAFHNAEDAVKAAVDAQINLANENWDEVRIKIRIGIHSGNVEWNGKRYMGYITLARTARVMSSAYGEQIIISNDAYEIAKEKIPNKISFRDLGERRLKDLKQPVRLFQILSHGLREDFPPLKTLDARPNNLPVQLTSFIGREAEMKTVKDLLKQTHLLTLTGSGGAGKTRLALQVGADVIDDFANGVWFVELAALSEPAFLPHSIMKVFDIKEEPKRSLEDTLCDYLRDKEILIILDNCEHLIEPCAKLTEKLLSSSPKLKIIATSREGLRCAGEQTHRVLSLEVPDPKSEDSPEALSQFEAVRLFIERALAVDSTFRVNNNNAPALAEICFQLDGIPLAIELAAARTKVLTVEQIYERLNDRFNLLTGGKRTALPRQQTLRALIDWSYDLLIEEEKILWRRLSVFAGGWTLEAAEEVCSDEKIRKNQVIEILFNLTEKSIIIFDKVKERYVMLEIIKHYGDEKLNERNEKEKFSDKHLKFYLELAETADMNLKGKGMIFWMKILDNESGNLRKGLKWSIENPADISESGLKFAGAMGYYWQIRGHLSEIIRWLEIILQKNSGSKNSFYCKVIYQVGKFSYFQGDLDKAKKYLEESLDLYSESEDKSGIANALNDLGIVTLSQGNPGKASNFHKKSMKICREIGDKIGIAKSLNNLGNVASTQNDFGEAIKLHRKSLKIRREIGDKLGIAKSLLNLGRIASDQGDYVNALLFCEECLSICREIGDKTGTVTTLNLIGILALEQGDYLKASRLYEECLEINRELENKTGVASVLNNIGILASHRGDYVRAFNLMEECLAIRWEMGDKTGIASSLNNLGAMANDQGEYEKASDLLEESLALRRELGYKNHIAASLINLGIVAREQGKLGQAMKLFMESNSIFQETGDKSEYALSLYGLGKTSFKKKKYDQARKYYKESLDLYQELENKRESGFTILGFMELHSYSENYIMVSKLLGFINCNFEANKVILPKSEQIIFDKLMLRMKKKLNEKEFSRYFKEGQKLTHDQAIELALSNTK